jgi:hypothetical protein
VDLFLWENDGQTYETLVYENSNFISNVSLSIGTSLRGGHLLYCAFIATHRDEETDDDAIAVAIFMREIVIAVADSGSNTVTL